MKLAVLIASTMLVFASNSAFAAEDPIIERLDNEIARWEKQKVSGDRDAKLADDVMVAFFTATSAKVVSPSAVNAALSPLFAKYPDYRLKYTTDADFCRVERAIRDAKVTALRRVTGAIGAQRKAMIIAQIRLSQQRQLIIGRITGEKPGQQSADAPFIEGIAMLPEDEIQTEWGGFDYSTAVPPGRNCG